MLHGNYIFELVYANICNILKKNRSNEEITVSTLASFQHLVSMQVQLEQKMSIVPGRASLSTSVRGASENDAIDFEMVDCS